MKKNVFGRKFKRDVNARTALFKGLMSELVLHGRIKPQNKRQKPSGHQQKIDQKAQKMPIWPGNCFLRN
jgi:ribosomal protein L17